MGYILTVVLSLTGVKGKVVDKNSGNPIEFAVVILFDTQGKQVDGTYTDSSGLFFIQKVKPGKYYLIADFVGYKKSRTDTFTLTGGILDIGVIYLSPSYVKTSPVVAKAKAPHVRREIDRTIVTPSRDVISSGGNASDVLKNVPGVTVSPTGEIMIKNSTNYLVLINNKPTMLPPDQALKQIPASQIQKIEIITNPSAEYDPESNAIINIVLKKAQFKFGKSLSATLGTFSNYGTSLTWGASKSKWNYYVVGSYFKYTQPIVYSIEMVSGDDTLRLNQTDFSISDVPANLRLGLIFSSGERTSMNFETEIGLYELLYDGDFRYSGTNGNYFNPINGYRKSSFYSFSFDLNKKFSNGEFNSTLYYGSLSAEKNNETPRIVDGDTVGGIKSSGDGTREKFRLDITYQRKISSLSLKTGYRYSLKEFESTTKTDFYSDSSYTNPLKSHRYIHAVYAKINGSHGKFTYGAGLRIEYMDRKVNEVKIRRTDFFPSLFFSTNITELSNLNLSYSRRIRRPSPYNINPVSFWETANELHIGNPSLRPEYDDSYEASFDIPLSQKFFLSASAYYTYAKDYFNKTERIENGIIIKREVNFPYWKDYGVNLTLEWAITKMLKFTLSPDLSWYEFKKLENLEKGIYYRFNVGFSGLVIPVGFIQLRLIYIGPYTESFGDFDPTFTAAFGYMIRIKSLSLVFSFNDIFHTLKTTIKNRTGDDYSRKEVSLRYPSLSLSIKFEPQKVKQGKKFKEEFEDIKSM